jgi:hypothetical protein
MFPVDAEPGLTGTFPQKNVEMFGDDRCGNSAFFDSVATHQSQAVRACHDNGLIRGVFRNLFPGAVFALGFVSESTSILDMDCFS